MEGKIVQVKIDQVIRTKRKTIALQITDDATLIVRAPFDVSNEAINRVVLKHSKWIENKKEQILSRDPKVLKKEFVNGEGFLYLGRYCRLKIVDNLEEPLRYENGFFLSRDYLPVAERVFIDWYKEKAYEKISERVEWYAKKRGFKYNKLNITSPQRRWGSCTSKKNLNFSWRLIMAPLPVIDYVVVHELVHLEERNHSKAFWEKVKMLMPEYEKHKEWLKEHEYMLRI